MDIVNKNNPMYGLYEAVKSSPLKVIKGRCRVHGCLHTNWNLNDYASFDTSLKKRPMKITFGTDSDILLGTIIATPKNVNGFSIDENGNRFLNLILNREEREEDSHIDLFMIVITFKDTFPSFDIYGEFVSWLNID